MAFLFRLFSLSLDFCLVELYQHFVLNLLFAITTLNKIVIIGTIYLNIKLTRYRKKKYVK